MLKLDAETEAKLKEIFQVVLDLSESDDVTVLRRLNCEKWDSLVTVSLVAAVESEFGVELNTTHQERFTSYESVLLLFDEIKS